MRKGEILDIARPLPRARITPDDEAVQLTIKAPPSAHARITRCQLTVRFSLLPHARGAPVPHTCSRHSAPSKSARPRHGCTPDPPVGTR